MLSMTAAQERKENLLREAEKLRARHELAGTMTPDFFEPGLMEYPEQWDGRFDPDSGRLTLRFEARGTRYEGRTEQIESVTVGDEIRVVRERENIYNPNNFTLLTRREKNVGNMPAELCNAIAPMYDAGELVLRGARVSYVEPISRRSRHAKQAVLFVELELQIL